ncbi:hypothetical protein [Altererythrobacter sp. Z27]|uniref:hypothetical protein n=1 Tax=Altererythrobacter sp. Z27 TaxID=3461147 RepID=UPI004044EE2B
MKTHSDEYQSTMSPEWHLDETAEVAEPYNFSSVNPRSVFALALLAAVVAVAAVLTAYLLIQFAMNAGAIPAPPALGPYVS